MSDTDPDDSQREKAQNEDWTLQRGYDVRGVDVALRIQGNELESERIWERLHSEIQKMQESGDE